MDNFLLKHKKGIFEFNSFPAMFNVDELSSSFGIFGIFRLLNLAVITSRPGLPRFFANVKYTRFKNRDQLFYTDVVGVQRYNDIIGCGAIKDQAGSGNC